MPTPLAGWPSTGWEAAYGGVPSVPSPISSMQETLAGDIGGLGRLYDLSRGVSSAAAEGARTQYAANLPMYTPMTQAGSENILANLQGIVNPDVINLLGSQAAERGIGFGPDSPATNAAYLRALGLTSAGLQNLGQQQLTAAIGRTPTGPMFNPASMLVTPEQMQEASWQANLMRAAPFPGAAARAGETAATRGIGAGLGVGGGGGRIPSGGAYTPIARDMGGMGGITAPSTATGLTYGGQTFYGGTTPRDFGTADWLASIGLGGAGGADYGMYDVTGMTPEDVSAFGSPWDYTSEGTAGGLPGETDWWDNAMNYDPFSAPGGFEGLDLAGGTSGMSGDSFGGGLGYDQSFEDIYP